MKLNIWLILLFIWFIEKKLYITVVTKLSKEVDIKKKS